MNNLQLKTCKKCEKELDILLFRKWRHTCNKCALKLASQRNIKRRLENPELIREKDKQYYYKNKDIILSNSRNRLNSISSENKEIKRLKNKEKRLLNKDAINAYKRSKYVKNKRKCMTLEKSKIARAISSKKSNLKRKDKTKISNKLYFLKNRDYLLARRRLYTKIRYKQDINYKLRILFNSRINRSINKNNKSIIKYLPYSFIELKKHIEFQFEPWMNWNNYGKYNKNTWDDNNILTWTWNIDHIIPHSIFKYTNMSDENFKKCWALDNLRPYSAKQNLLDGVQRTRHE